MAYKANFTLSGLDGKKAFSIPLLVEYDYEPPKFKEGPTFIGIMSIAVVGAENQDIGMLVIPGVFSYLCHEINVHMAQFPPSEEQRTQNAKNMAEHRVGVSEWLIYSAIDETSLPSQDPWAGQPPTVQ